jgi:hypothetical protein
LSTPAGVSLDASGNVYVADVDLGKVFEFASAVADGQLIRTIGTFGTGFSQLNQPVGVAVDTESGGVFVGDTHNNRVQIYSGAGVWQESTGSAGAGDGQLSLPHGLAVVPNGDVYVTDYGNNRIEEFTKFGSFVRTFGNPGLSAPTAVALNSAHSMLYVADQNNSRIAVFTSNGSFVTSFGSLGSGAGQMNGPDGVAVTKSGMVYVADTNNNRIERWFDPASWSSGTNTFTNSALGPTNVGVGAGQLLGTSLTLTSGKGLVVGGTTIISSGGNLNLSGGLLSTNVLVPSGGTFTYTGGTLSPQEIAVQAGGTFDATQGGSFNAPSGTLISDAGSMFKLGGGAQLTTSAFVVQNGTVQIGNATINANGPPGLFAPLTIAGGVLQLSNPTTSILQGALMVNSGSISGSGMIEAPFTNQTAGSVAVTAGQSLTFTQDASNDGSLSLGGGNLAFDTKLNLTSHSQLLFTLGGTTVGTGYGQINVTGALTAAGKLSVVLGSGLLLHGGEQFHLLSFAGESGTFANVTLPTITPGLHWDTSLLYAQGIARVSIPGDVNNDGIVNGQDIAVVSSNYLATGASVPGDANGDGLVNGQDIAIASSNWLHTYDSISGNAAAVPEPSTFVLTALGGSLLAGRRRRGVR